MAEPKDAGPARLYHGTTSTRWSGMQADGVLRRAPLGDLCVSLTDDYRVARYFAENSCSAEAAEGVSSDPVVLLVDVTGLDARPHSSAVWGEGECTWERETACWEDVPISRVSPVPPARAVRYDAIAYRIQRGDEIVAMALQLANDRWAIHDLSDRRIDRATYATPKAAADSFERAPPNKERLSGI